MPEVATGRVNGNWRRIPVYKSTGQARVARVGAAASRLRARKCPAHRDAGQGTDVRDREGTLPVGDFREEAVEVLSDVDLPDSLDRFGSGTFPADRFGCGGNQRSVDPQLGLGTGPIVIPAEHIVPAAIVQHRPTTRDEKVVMGVA